MGASLLANRDVGTSSALQPSCCFATNPTVMGRALRTQKSTGSGRFVWEPVLGGMDVDGTMAGYRALATSNLPDNLGVERYLSAMMFGNFTELLIRFWSAIELLADPYGDSFASGALRVRGLVDVDVDVDVRHAVAFSSCLDIDGSI